MKNYDDQINEKIQKYLEDVKHEKYTINEIESRPRWKRVWFLWKALEYYENKPFPQLTLDEVKKIYGK